MTARLIHLLPMVFRLAEPCFAQTSGTPQQPAAGSPTQVEAAGGVAAPWDAQKLLADVNSGNQEMTPLLGQINPQEGLARGAFLKMIISGTGVSSGRAGQLQGEAFQLQ